MKKLIFIMIATMMSLPSQAQGYYNSCNTNQYQQTYYNPYAQQVVQQNAQVGLYNYNYSVNTYQNGHYQ